MSAPVQSRIFTQDRAVTAIQDWTDSLVRYLDTLVALPKYLSVIDTDGVGGVNVTKSFARTMSVSISGTTDLPVEFESPMSDADYVLQHSLILGTSASDRLSTVHNQVSGGFTLNVIDSSSGSPFNVTTTASRFTVCVWGELA